MELIKNSIYIIASICVFSGCTLNTELLPSREALEDEILREAPVILSGAPLHSGNLNETPRFFLGTSLNAEAASNEIHSYEARLTDTDGGEIVPWTQLGVHDSFVLSKYRSDEEMGIKKVSSLKLIDNKSYQVHLRSYNQLHQRSNAAIFEFAAQAPRILIPSVEYAAKNAWITRSFLAEGVGDGVPFSINGGRVCEEPCDIESTSTDTLLIQDGKSYKVGGLSGPWGFSLDEFDIAIGTPPFQQKTKWFISTSTICNGGYVFVPEDPVLSTKAFCIAQFEMKKDPSSPEPLSSLEGEVYTGLNKLESQQACESIYARLPSNTEWNAVARNIANEELNWFFDENGNKLKLNRGNSSGSGVLNNSTNIGDHCEGTSDSPCFPHEWKPFKRTHQLSTGEFIWDFVGNAWEIVSDDVVDYELPNLENLYLANLAPTSFMNFVLGLPASMACYQPYNNDYCNLGWGWISGAKPGKAIYRGGTKHSGNNAGPFTIDYDEYPSNRTDYHGFRCVYDIVEPI